MKKPDTTKKSKGAPSRCPDPRFGGDYPQLTSHLSDTTWDDGSARERSTLTLFVEDGAFKLALNDRDSSQSLYVAADTLVKALEGLERILKEGSGDWRGWKRKK